MLNRRITRVLLNATEITSGVSAPGGSETIAMTDSDFLYVGFYGKFASRHFEVATANDQTSVLSCEYWDGTAWQAVDDLIDQTASAGKTLAQSGFVSWTNKSDWQAKNQTGTDADLELFWVRFSVSATLAVTTALGSVLNLFSDDTLLSIYYPELVSDAAYLPSGKTDFLDQHIAAKDLVVLRLKQRKIIDQESQIIDINDVAIASVHAAALTILRPIATSPDTQNLFEKAQTSFNDEISKVSFAVDTDKSGIISEAERGQVLSVGVYRR